MENKVDASARKEEGPQYDDEFVAFGRQLRVLVKLGSALRVSCANFPRRTYFVSASGQHVTALYCQLEKR